MPATMTQPRRVVLVPRTSRGAGTSGAAPRRYRLALVAPSDTGRPPVGLRAHEPQRCNAASL